MKYNLSKRLFVITLSILLLMMGLTMLFQVLFFQIFYEEKKQDELIKELSTFKDFYSYQLNTQNYANTLSAFENRTNSKIGIFTLNSDKQYRLKYFTNPYSKEDTEASEALEAYFSEICSNSNLIDTVVNDDKPSSTVFYNKSSSTKKIGVMSAFSLSSRNDAIIISVSSVEPIEEASSVITEFYIYISIGFVIISIVMSSIYSNLISKPLIIINNVAKKMSNMDFSAQCNEDRNDEIGNLASTLNFLSSNLDYALEDLKNKNKQLEKDIEKERNLEVMRKDFIASVSHELKTPIGIIEGYAEGIKDGIVKDKDALVYLETIIDESKKMGVLVSNMLELSKLESGVIKPKPEVFNINRLINKLVKKHSPEASEKNLQLLFYENTEYSYVLADIFQMEQVLTNLITNALKYTAEGNKIIISINLCNDNYVISVVNTGTQIANEELDKVFNKFYKVDKSRNRKTNSTGLGLSIVKNLLDLHGFNYSLKNIKNAVKFEFSIPKEDPDFE
ncbi:MAG: two-component sensor histidine kinase [Clostridiales bacterium]|nr:two-component sensor histidine kinase [Clostridiales bacterium]